MIGSRAWLFTKLCLSMMTTGKRLPDTPPAIVPLEGIGQDFVVASDLPKTTVQWELT